MVLGGIPELRGYKPPGKEEYDELELERLRRLGQTHPELQAEYPWFRELMKEQPLEPLGGRLGESRIPPTPFQEGLGAAGEQVGQLTAPFEEVGKISGSLLTAPFYEEGRETLTTRPEQFLYPGSEARKTYEEEVPGVAKFVAEEALFLPLYLFTGGRVTKEGTQLIGNILRRAQLAERKFLEKRLLTEAEKSTLRIARESTVKGVVNEEKLLRLAYGSPRIGGATAQMYTTAGMAVKKTAAPAFKQLTMRTWDTMDVPARAELAKSVGLEGKVGAKAWGELSVAEKKGLRAAQTAAKPKEVPVGNVPKTGQPFETTGYRGTKPMEDFVGMEDANFYGSGTYYAADVPGAKKGLAELTAQRYATTEPFTDLTGEALQKAMKEAGGSVETLSIKLKNPFVIYQGKTPKWLDEAQGAAQRQAIADGKFGAEFEKAVADGISDAVKAKGHDGLIAVTREGYLEVIPYGKQVAQKATKVATEGIPKPPLPAPVVPKAVGKAEVVASNKAAKAAAKQAKQDETAAMAVVKLTKSIEETNIPIGQARELYHKERQRQAATIARGLPEAAAKGIPPRLRGEYISPKLAGKFKRPELTWGQGFTNKERDALHLLAIESPKLKPFDVKRLIGGVGDKGIINKLLDVSDIPSMSDLKLLEKVFGARLVFAIWKRRPFSEKVWDTIQEVTNLPRAIRASFDLSATLRQGYPVLPMHPKEFGRAFKAQLKALSSKENARLMNEELLGLTDDVALNKIAQRRLDAGVFIADLGIDATAREEAFMSRFLQRFAADYSKKSPLKKIVGAPLYPLGKEIELSERAYITFLNKLRADLFDGTIRGWEKSGKKFTKFDEVELARFYNNLTGRGVLGMGEYGKAGHILQNTQGVLLNAMFFSPRFQTSRFMMHASMFSRSTAVKKIAARDLAAFYTSNAAVLGLISLIPGVEVETDTRSPDFGKARFGKNIRIDIWAGLQPYIRLIGQIKAGERLSPATGGLREINAYGAILHAIRGKLSPTWGVGADVFSGSTYIGQDMEYDTDFMLPYLIEQLSPMTIQDIKDSLELEGVEATIALSPSIILGEGVQIYESSLAAVGEHRTQISTGASKTEKIRALEKDEKYDEALEFAQKNLDWKFEFKNGEWTSLALADLRSFQRDIDGIEDMIEEIEESDMPDDQKDKRTEDLAREALRLSVESLLIFDDLPTEKDYIKEYGQAQPTPQRQLPPGYEDVRWGK